MGTEMAQCAKYLCGTLKPDFHPWNPKEDGKRTLNLIKLSTDLGTLTCAYTHHTHLSSKNKIEKYSLMNSVRSHGETHSLPSPQRIKIEMRWWSLLAVFEYTTESP